MFLKTTQRGGHYMKRDFLTVSRSCFPNYKTWSENSEKYLQKNFLKFQLKVIKSLHVQHIFYEILSQFLYRMHYVQNGLKKAKVYCPKNLVMHIPVFYCNKNNEKYSFIYCQMSNPDVGRCQDCLCYEGTCLCKAESCTAEETALDTLRQQ
jgi:hypothetical protein